ncbi:MAG: HAD family hydrolase [Candidatus Binatia bacterium]
MNSSRPITTILFDAGGTLVHTDLRFIHKLLRQAGITATLQVIRRAECASKQAIDRRMEAAAVDTDETRRHPYFAAMLEHLGIGQDQAAHLLRRIEAEHQHANLWRLMRPSTPQILQELRSRGLVLGVVSNSDGRIRSVLAQCGITDFFQVVIDSHDVGMEKPDPRIFQFALDTTKARPEQTVYVGDIYSIDVVGAERVGMEPVLLDGVGSYAAGLPCRTIKHLRSLLSLVS